MLQAGDKLPNFELQSDQDKAVSAKSLLGQRYVLYFYPKDDTPGCTTEACGFRDALPDFSKLGVRVFGVSADSVKSHQKFVTKYQLTFELLADPERALIEPLGVWVEKSMYGKKYMGIQRATFVVDTQGRIEKVWEKVSVSGHVDEVHAFVSGAEKAPKAGATKIVAKKTTAAKKSGAAKKTAK